MFTTVVLKYSDLNNLVEAIKFMYFGMERSSSIELIVLQPFYCNLLHLYTDTLHHKLIRTTDPIINDSCERVLSFAPHSTHRAWLRGWSGSL